MTVEIAEAASDEQANLPTAGLRQPDPHTIGLQ